MGIKPKERGKPTRPVVTWFKSKDAPSFLWTREGEMTGDKAMPCPFCGGAAQLGHIDTNPKALLARCQVIGCPGNHWSGIIAWNRRTPTPAREDLATNEIIGKAEALALACIERVADSGCLCAHNKADAGCLVPCLRCQADDYIRRR